MKHFKTRRLTATRFDAERSTTRLAAVGGSLAANDASRSPVIRFAERARRMEETSGQPPGPADGPIKIIQAVALRWAKVGITVGGGSEQWHWGIVGTPVFGLGLGACVRGVRHTLSSGSCCGRRYSCSWRSRSSARILGL